MTDVSLFRLYALRAGYLLVAVGIAATMWPLLINHSPEWPLMNSVVCSLLAACLVLRRCGHSLSAADAAGPALRACLEEHLADRGRASALVCESIDARTWETVRDCLLAVILIPLIPWRYVISQYVTKPGDRWRRTAGIRATPASGDEKSYRLRSRPN